MNDWLYELTTKAMYMNSSERMKLLEAADIIIAERDELPEPEAMPNETPEACAGFEPVKEPTTPCPHCGPIETRKYGFSGGKGSKQRFECRSCGKTYTDTANTLMYYSQQSKEAWEAIVQDTAIKKASF